MSEERKMQPSTEMVAAKRSFLTGKNMLAALKQVATKHISPERLARVAMAAISRNPRLLQCTNESLAQAIVKCAEVGLEPSLMGDVYLVPYFNSKINAYEAQFQIGYQGLGELAFRGHGIIVKAEVVYDCDRFEEVLGLNPDLKHKRGERTADSKRVFSYAIATFPDGRKLFEVVDAIDIEKAKRSSRGSDKSDSPWVQHPDAMWRKTAARRISKWLPKSPEMGTALDYDTAVDAEIDLPAAADPNDITNQSSASAAPESRPEPTPTPEPTPQEKPAQEVSKPASRSTQKKPTATTENADPAADSRKRMEIQKLAAKLSSVAGQEPDPSKILHVWAGGLSLNDISGAELDSIYEAALGVLADAQRTASDSKGELPLNTKSEPDPTREEGLAGLIEGMAGELAEGDADKLEEILNGWFDGAGFPQDATLTTISIEDLQRLHKHAEADYNKRRNLKTTRRRR